MLASTHIINRQVFEFECLHSEHAFQIRNKFDGDVQNKISKIINDACDQISVEDFDIRIPKLEIDLGRISFKELAGEILVNFEKEFYGKLAEYKNLRPDAKAGLYARHKSLLEIIKFFLLTGRLPWFAGKQDKNFLAGLFEAVFTGQYNIIRDSLFLDLEEKAAEKPGKADKNFHADLFEEIFTDQYDAIRNFIFLNLENERFVERLAGQIGPLRINEIIGMLGFDTGVFSDMQKAISKIMEEIILLLKNSVNKDMWVSDITTPVQDNAAKQEEITNLLIRYLEGNRNAFFPQIQRLAFLFILKLITDKKDIYSLEIIFESFEKFFEEKFELNRTVLHPLLLKEQEYFQNLPAAVSNTKKELESETINAPDDQMETVDIAEMKFYISNAGLILIANYFPAFFKQLKLLDDGKFTSKDNQVKAVFLLHYLCTGTEEAPEYILPFNKILCGLPSEEPLPSYLSLNENEKNECRELLSEVIYNWQKLGNSSIEALQEAFLNREAILSYENNGWKLLVERKGYDVLIDSLPWSFSHTKLSWMQDLITTEW